MRRLFLLLLISLSLLLGACQSSDYQLTLAANHALGGTQIQDLRITGTVQAARAQTTLDFMGTRFAAAATRSQYLEATLINEGTPAEYLATYRSRIIQVQPTATQFVPPATNAMQQVAVATPLPVSNASPTIPGVTPFNMLITQPPTRTPRPTIDPNAATIQDPRLALSSGDDCGANFTTQFTTSTSAIYVIVPVTFSPAGTTFEARWQRDGQTVGGIFAYTPDFVINNNCIWFFVDQTDFEFMVGTYSVIIDVNGIPATNPATFTIIDG